MQKTLALLLACLLLVPHIALAETLAGRVVRVLDGDTVAVLTSEKQEVRVRLAEIDAPEKDQPFGMKAKKMLSDLVFAKEVTVVKNGIDRHRRPLGRIYQGQTDVNLEMVRAGGAWAYTEYLTDGAFRAAEDAARAATLGLWALQEDQRIPPWEWRHPEGNKTPSPSVEHATTAQHPEPGEFTCAGKWQAVRRLSFIYSPVASHASMATRTESPASHSAGEIPLAADAAADHGGDGGNGGDESVTS